jgi:hypothetical protein
MPAKNDEWSELAKRHVKAALARHDVKYADLAKRLTDMGLPETEGSLQVKINRGTFPAWFMLAVLRAVGAHTLHLE